MSLLAKSSLVISEVFKHDTLIYISFPLSKVLQLHDLAGKQGLVWKYDFPESIASNETV